MSRFSPFGFATHMLLILSLASFKTAAFAQAPLQEKREPITTDRPDFTEAAIVVPRHYLQIENGFTYQSSRRVYSLSGPETLFRYGVADRFEMRLGLPDYNRQRTGGLTATGFSDLYLGAKYQIGPCGNGWELSVIPAMFLPTGQHDFSSGGIDPEIKLCFSRDLSPKWDVSGMFYGSLPTENGRRNATLQTTLSFGWDLGRKWRMFNEYAGTFSRHAGPQHLYHSGFTYLIHEDMQFDVHYGYGLNNNVPQSFVGAGLSFRFKTH